MKIAAIHNINILYGFLQKARNRRHPEW